MTAETILSKLKKMYTATFDLEENSDCAGRQVNLYGHFNVDNSRYVLSKKATLWEANCQEHLFVQAVRSEAMTDGRLPAVEAGHAECEENPEMKKEAEQEAETELDLFRLQELDKWLREKAEPYFVRKGEEYPPKNHMYTYLTVVLITDKKINDDVKRFAKKYKFERTYKWTLRGYMQTRLVLVSTADNVVITNGSGKVLEKTYQTLVG